MFLGAVTGIASRQQTALEICKHALSSTKDVVKKERLEKALSVLQAAVDEVPCLGLLTRVLRVLNDFPSVALHPHARG